MGLLPVFALKYSDTSPRRPPTAPPISGLLCGWNFHHSCALKPFKHTLVHICVLFLSFPFYVAVHIVFSVLKTTLSYFISINLSFAALKLLRRLPFWKPLLVPLIASVCCSRDGTIFWSRHTTQTAGHIKPAVHVVLRRLFVKALWTLRLWWERGVRGMPRLSALHDPDC
jgi:hypothetical protein